MRVSLPSDPAEREARDFAARVVRMPDAPAATGAGNGDLRSARTGVDGTHRVLRVSAAVDRAGEGGGTAMPADVASDIAQNMSGGNPLPDGVRAFMEPRLRAGFGAVRVHTDERASRLSARLAARAFTVRNHVFFGKDAFQPGSDDGRELIAHELTHTIQQGAVVQRSELTRVAQRAAPQVQRFGISDALDYIADKANYIPGFRMFTIILGVNPINMSRVERSAANVLRAVIEFIPGGALITQAMANHGVFDRVGSWVDQQIKALGMTGGAIKRAVSTFLDSLSWRDVFHLGDVWTRAKRIFTEPIERIFAFVKGLLAGIVKLIKDAILRPLAKLADGTRGYDLLKAVLGYDPVTNDPYPQTADAVIGGFMKLIGEEEIWNNLKKANAVARAWAWFKGALSGLLGFVKQIPSVFVKAFQSLEIADIVLLPRAFVKVASVFGEFLGRFISWAGNTIWELLEIIVAVVAPRVLVYVKKAGAAFRTILKNPVGFVGNLVRAGRLGLDQFATRFGVHLKNSLIKWLTGAMEGAAIYVPQALNAREIIKFALSALGLTWQNIRQKLVVAVGETSVKVLETTFEIVTTLVKEGPAAAWEKIKEQLTNLQELVVGEIVSFVTSKIVQSAIKKLVMMLNPAGAVIQAIIAIYNTIMFFVERLKQIAEVVAAFVDSLAAIAGGAVAAAATKVEQTLAGLLTLAISFLARIADLGKVSEIVINIVNKLRAPINTALDKVVEWIVGAARKLGKLAATAAQKVVGWWGARVGFKVGGEAHTLFFEGEATAAELNVASKKQTLEQFLDERAGEFTADDPETKVIKDLRVSLAELRKQIRASNKTEGDRNTQRDIETKMNAIGQKLPQLSTGGEWGTESNPVFLEYQKRRGDAYPVFYLASGADVARLKQGTLKARFEANAADRETRIRRFHPATEQHVFKETEKLGLGTGSRLEVGTKLEFKEKTKRGGGVNDFKSLLKKYGLTASDYGWDVDHVVELQIGGRDDWDNLWPLPLGENRSSGSLIKEASVEIPGKPKPMKVAAAAKAKQKEKKSLWMMIKSTRQR